MTDLSNVEQRLWWQINRGLPEDTQARFTSLKEMRQTEALTAPEYDELLAITEQIEQRDVERLQALTELAQLRGVSVRALMHRINLLATNDT